MKKLIVFAILFVTVVTGYAQSVDNFIVGPYEVDYIGEGEFKYRLRKGIDLYEYFGLEKDTIIQIMEPECQPVKNGIQINLFMSLPRFTTKGNSNTFGLNGSWKLKIGKIIYLNAGLSFGFSYGKYSYIKNYRPFYRKDAMIELGVPVSIEITKLDKKKASLYAGIGFTPTFYGTIKADETIIKGLNKDGEKDSGFYIAPRVDFGGYIPLNNQIVRLGIFGEYRINCFGDINIYKERVGREFVGANVGLIF